MFAPMQKKVARALCFFNCDRTQGVTSGIGPSSKERNIAPPLLSPPKGEKPGRAPILQMEEGYKVRRKKFGRTEYMKILLSKIYEGVFREFLPLGQG